MMKLREEKSGFTLIELLVTTGLFLILVTLVSTTFVQGLRAQRIVTSFNVSISNASFAIEQMSREIRTGHSFEGVGEVETLSFINQSDEPVHYKLINRQAFSGIGRCVGSCLGETDYKFLTDTGIKVENLKFILEGTPNGDNLQSRVTVIISLKGEKDLKVNLQTTISPRILDS